MICIDTSVLIWGFEKSASPTYQHMIKRCEEFLAQATREQREIGISSVVLSEFLVGCSKRQELYSKLVKQYRIVPFDGKAANILGEMQSGMGPIGQRCPGSTEPRHCLKADMMIIASAIAYNAQKIITHNVSEYRTLSRGKILISDIPELPIATPPAPVRNPQTKSRGGLFDIFNEADEIL